MGLTDFGKDAVAEMNKLGMIIDVSHLTQQAFQDVLEISHDPFVISHGVAGMEQILGQHKAMAEKGGVLGVHFFYSYLRKEGKKHINLKDLLDKIDYCVENLGIDSVALGADFFPTTGSWVDLQHAQGTFNIEWAIRDVSKMLEVTEGLVTRGYSDGEIQKILGGNFLRVCKRVFGH
jgi:membrane dipeptidase